MEKERVYLLAVAAALASKKKRAKRRSKWVKDWLLERSKFSHINLLNELIQEPSDWMNYLRMDKDTYLMLLNRVTPLIKKQDTHMRRAITPHERLTATLRFLATGRSYEDMKFSTIISPQALGEIIPETCEAIYTVLKDEFLKFPKTEDEWKAIANDFENRWNFPGCLGAVDGKHVQIVPPKNSGSYYYNYKGSHSLVLMAIANANYELIMVDFGTNGRVSDGGVIENTLFYEKLKNHTLHLPNPKQCTNGRKLPYVFIGDEAFALRPDFLKPFSQKQLNKERKIFNYRLSRARRIIENVFGIMASRFRIFHTAINLKLENVEKVVLACCALHNFLRRQVGSNYIPATCLDVENIATGNVQLGLRTEQHNLIDLQNGHNRHASEEAQQVRNLYMTYFCNEGAVAWQENCI